MKTIFLAVLLTATNVIAEPCQLCGGDVKEHERFLLFKEDYLKLKAIQAASITNYRLSLLLACQISVDQSVIERLQSFKNVDIRLVQSSDVDILMKVQAIINKLYKENKPYIKLMMHFWPNNTPLTTPATTYLEAFINSGDD
ncbi:hypothetical protein [Endozoicomonas sp. Mp262]|uniref:hypothetical protein n=1 Tax=Endozoicomonas sp. Mp262 TaxID=2919499 RepID=UPI0021D8C974